MKVFRFTATAAATLNVSWVNLLDSLNMAATATTAYQLCDRVRVRAVEVWAASAASGTPVTVSCEFAGVTAGFVGRSRIVSDTTIGTARLAHIRLSPDRASQASQWQFSNGAPAFQLVVPAGAVIDVHLNLTVRDTNAAGTAVANPPAGATVGQVYVRGLDGIAVATTNFPPVSYTAD